MSAVPATQDNQTRVVLAGRTGLEGVLRRDPAFDLRRASNAMDAIGEAVGDGAVGERAPVSAVLVGEMLDRSLETGERARFIEGLKRAAPGTRVILVSAGAGVGVYDACLTGGETAREVMQAISQPSRRSARTPVQPGAHSVERGRVQLGPAPPSPAPPSPAPPDSTQPDSTRPGPTQPDPALGAPVSTPTGTVGDQSLLQQLTGGRDILPPAVDLIRQRLGDPTVAFKVEASDPEADRACPVITSQGVLLGHLISDHPRGGAEGLDAHASWLAGWMVLARQLAQLRQQALTDHLTGAWNRRFFDRYMAGAVERARRDRRDLTLLVFDLDDFKPFNDRFGHAAGDLILIETVRLLRSVIRPTDKVARIGGDEFVVIFDDPAGPRDPGSRHPISVREIAGRFQSQIRSHRFPSLGIDAPGSLSVSGGIATFPWDGQTPEDLLRRADERAIESKQCGKNIITIGPDWVE